MRSRRKGEHVSLVNQVFGERLAQARRVKGLSQSELGRRVGVTRATIGNLESGKQSVLLHQVYLIAHQLNLTVDELLPPRSDIVFGPDSEPPETRFLQQAKRTLKFEFPGGANEDS